MSSEFDIAKNGGKKKEIEIIVNGTPYSISDPEVTYEQVVQLAFPGANDPNVTHSVAYRKAHGNGGHVKVKKGTSFNVTPTTRS